MLVKWETIVETDGRANALGQLYIAPVKQYTSYNLCLEAIRQTFDNLVEFLSFLLVFDMYCFNIAPLAFIQLWIFAIKINIKSGTHTQTTELWIFLVYSQLPSVLVSAPDNHQPPTSQMAGFYGFTQGLVLKLSHSNISKTCLRRLRTGREIFHHWRTLLYSMALIFDWLLSED